MSYSETPTLSVDAIHDKSVEISKVFVAIRLVGAVGGSVSNKSPVKSI